MDFKLGALMNVSLAQDFNPFYATHWSVSYPLKTSENLWFSYFFQKVSKETGGMMWVKWC